MKATTLFCIVLGLIACCPKKADRSKMTSSIHRHNVFDKLALHKPMYTLSQADTIYDTPAGEDPDSLMAALLVQPGVIEDTAQLEFHLYRQGLPQTRAFLQKMRKIQAYSSLATRLQLPQGSKILELKDLKALGINNRQLILWMIQPKVSLSLDSMYTCPEYSEGKAYMTGTAYVSLIDTQDDSLINSVKLRSAFTILDTDTLKTHKIKPVVKIFPVVLPLSSLKKQQGYSAMGGLYHAANATDSTDGITEVLHLLDYNADGDALEFALYENMGCAITETSLYGYSIKQDRVLAYPISYYQIDETQGSTVEEYTDIFIDKLFMQAPINYPVAYYIDYRGRGGNICEYRVSYDHDCEGFEAVVRYKNDASDSTRSSWIPYPVFQ